MNTILNKSYYYAIIKALHGILLSIDNDILRNKTRATVIIWIIIKALRNKDKTGFLAFEKEINNNLNKALNSVLQKESRFNIDIIYRLIILDVINKINIVISTQTDMKKKNEKINFQFKIWWYIENVIIKRFESRDEVRCIFTLIEIQFK